MKLLVRFLGLILLVLSCALVHADVVVDETFEGKTPFADLRYAAGAEAAAKGINVSSHLAAPRARIQFDPSSLFTQGRLISYVPRKMEDGLSLSQNASHLAGGKAHCWVLSPAEQIFWGKSGNSGISSGLGEISSERSDIVISQAAIAIPLSAAQKETRSLAGSIAFSFGGRGSLHTLKYNFVSIGNGMVSIREIRDGANVRPVGSIGGNSWAQVTTVWASSIGKEWRMENAPKGWLTGTMLTSPALTCVYTFVNGNPLGDPHMPAAFADDPWILPDAGKEGVQLRTVCYAAGPDDPMLLDNLYLETDSRGGEVSRSRLHAFNEVYPELPINFEVSLAK